MSDNEIYAFDDEDQKMQLASENARKTFKYFWRELSWEYRRIVPGLDLAIVKVPFATDGNDTNIPPFEYMWISEISFDGNCVSGVLMNEPQWVTGLSSGDEVCVPLEEMTDWMYVSQDKVYGAFTVHTMRAAMTKAERQKHDATWGFNFGDPNEVQMTPYTHSESKGFISKAFVDKKSSEDNLLIPEHPMSENMAEKIEKALKDRPSIATEKDEEGWTLLQRESLAGNLTPVKILLQYGADPNEINCNGQSAVDLAKKMDWEEVSEVLKSHI